MSKKQNEVIHLMESYGFVLVRSGHHMVWRHPQLGQVVTSATCSDWRGKRNIISVIQRIAKQKGLTTTQV